MSHALTPILGTNFDGVDTTARHELGTTVTGQDGLVYVYCQANGAIAASQADISVTDVTWQASDGAGTFIGPAVAIADNEYFWAAAAQELKNIT